MKLKILFTILLFISLSVENILAKDKPEIFFQMGHSNIDFYGVFDITSNGEKIASLSLRITSGEIEVKIWDIPSGRLFRDINIKIDECPIKFDKCPSEEYIKSYFVEKEGKNILIVLLKRKRDDSITVYEIDFERGSILNKFDKKFDDLEKLALNEYLNDLLKAGWETKEAYRRAEDKVKFLSEIHPFIQNKIVEKYLILLGYFPYVVHNISPPEGEEKKKLAIG